LAKVQRDRGQAIRQAISRAQANDVVLIAGKGHEDYQIVGTTRRHFSDRDVARAALEART
jgi:UDP-N-acetylmuramoyl-L-alanyl-D-glutamate--2,6-diaminopimelate ligase